MKENKDEKERKQLEQEKRELNTLINKGISFEVKDVELVCNKRFFGLKKKYTEKEVVRKFRIDEMTLGTLDRLSQEWIEFAIDEAKMKTADGMKFAHRFAYEHSRRCARIIAIAVMGEELMIPKPKKGGGTRWVEDVLRLEELTNLFVRKIKPSMLHNLCSLVDAMCNLGDFLNSIRLMSAERTTMPIRIEESNAG